MSIESLKTQERDLSSIIVQMKKQLGSVRRQLGQRTRVNQREKKIKGPSPQDITNEVLSEGEVTTPQPALYTEQAATFLGLAESSLEKMRCYGGGPKFVKMGKRVTYRLQDLEDYQSERVMASTSEYQPTKAA